MKIKNLFWLGLTLAALSASAQVVIDPDWKETEAPAPPTFNKNKLISLDMPNYVTLKFGVDPATLIITPDSIVRYVVVAANATGASSAMYEGIRCATWQVKTYARYSANGQWLTVRDPQWEGLNDNRPSKHALMLAKKGICDSGSTTANSVADIVKALKN